MNSSLDKVQINTADKTELQKLQGIGSRRAERIIQYREVEGSFKDSQQLAKVTGISLDQAKYLSTAINWSIAKETYPSWLPPVLIVTVTLLVLFLSPLVREILSQLHKFDGSPISTISLAFNTAVLLLAFGSAALAFTWSMGPYLQGSGVRMITASLVITTSAFMILLVAGLLGIWLMPDSAGLLSHGLRVLPLLVTVVLVIYMLYGPQLIYRITQDTAQLIIAAKLFDLSLLPLAFAALVFCFVENGSQVILHLSLLWAGIMFTVQGFTLAKRSSCFTEALEALTSSNVTRELRDSIQLINKANPAAELRTHSGQIVVAIGGFTTLYAGMQLLHTTLA